MGVNQFERLFISILEEKVDGSCPYSSLPSNYNFTGFVREILYCLKKERDGIISTGYSEILIKSFYMWIINEKIFKEEDYLFYCQLVNTLKTYSEGTSVSKTDRYAFFEYVNKSRIYKYHTLLFSKIEYCYNKNICDEDAYDYINLFIDDLIALETNYSFLKFVLNCYKDNRFKNFLELIQYLHYANMDSYDIFIPMNNYSKKDEKIFELKRQTVEQKDGIFYCKVYANKTMDFYYLVRENILRIESVFNILRFYNNSQIAFDFHGEIIVESQFFHDKFVISMSDILCYKRATPNTDKYLESVVDALEKIKAEEKDAYHRILNVISYAEKDCDQITPSSYVDNWISLETLISMSGREKGYDSVRRIVPKMLSAKLLFEYLQYNYSKMKRVFNENGKRITSLKDFIVILADDNFDKNWVANDEILYLKIKELKKRFSSLSKIKNAFYQIENKVEIDLTRIYILRNEYVHASNLRAFSSMQPYLLKYFLSSAIDEFFRLLKNRIERDKSDFSVIFDAFSDLINRHDIRETAFLILLEEKKYVNGQIKLHVELKDVDITYEDFVTNLLKSNSALFKKYVANR